MTLLIVGLVLWVAAHVFKRVVPGARAGMTEALGAKSNGIFAALIVLSLLLIVIGYRGVEIIPVYAPLAGMGHLNNLLMLVALVIYSAGMSKGVLWTKMRHPQLIGVSIWAVAHFLVKGDLAAILLFGTMLVWALVSMGLINAQEPGWTAPRAGALKRDLVMVGGALVAYGIITGIHMALGLNPFLGTYA